TAISTSSCRPAARSVIELMLQRSRFMSCHRFLLIEVDAESAGARRAVEPAPKSSVRRRNVTDCSRNIRHRVCWLISRVFCTSIIYKDLVTDYFLWSHERVAAGCLPEMPQTQRDRKGASLRPR